VRGCGFGSECLAELSPTSASPLPRSSESYDPPMRLGARWITAVVLLGVTLAGTAWLYLCRVPSAATFIDRRGYVFHPPYATTVQPWWSVFAAVLVFVTGAAASVWIIAGRSRSAAVLARVMKNGRWETSGPSSGRLVLGLFSLGPWRCLAEADSRLGATLAHLTALPSSYGWGPATAEATSFEMRIHCVWGSRYAVRRKRPIAISRVAVAQPLRPRAYASFARPGFAYGVTCTE
jgi:hypothetical protein